MKKFTFYILQFTIKIILLIFTFYILHSTFYITPVHAAVNIGEFFGYGGNCPSNEPNAICSLGQGTSKLVMPFFSLAAVIVVIYFLVGAYKYLTSGGNKEEVEGARNMITHAIIGFILLMFAFLVLQFLMTSLFHTQLIPLIGI